MKRSSTLSRPRRRAGIASGVFLLHAARLVMAEPAFEEVSCRAGLTYVGPTAGASWGDLDGDGWPDLWVGNHQGHAPVLYRNQADGTFTDVGPAVLHLAASGDLHGAAWGDFDNDGDQDLIVASGGGAGRGHSPNLLYVNEHGRMRERGSALGVDYPQGRGRTPLWVDADRDGRLDLLLMNYRRPDRSAPSALLLQRMDRFESSNRRLGFSDIWLHRWDRLRRLLNDYGLYDDLPGRVDARLWPFAQLADLSGDGEPDLIAYAQVTRIYGIASTPFVELTDEIQLPKAPDVTDAAIADFDGDGRLDIYLVRERAVTDLVRRTATELEGTLHAAGDQAIFRTQGGLHLDLYPPWRDSSDPRDPPRVMVGSALRPPDVLSLRIEPEAARTDRSEIPTAPPDVVAQLVHDPVAGHWTLRAAGQRLNFRVRTTSPIESFEASGTEPDRGALRDLLLLQSSQQSSFAPAANTENPPTSCSSVAAGDFDNDTDVDLYLVCRLPLENRPNLLLENVGGGRFVPVPNAGGAAGSPLGRGDVVVTADYDRDGFLDLFVSNGFGPPPFNRGPHQLFHNRGNANHWLEIDLEGVSSNRDGTGAAVVIESGGVAQQRVQGGGMHSFAQDHRRLHFGLGASDRVERLTVRWPSGLVQELRNLEADRVWVVREAE